MLNLSEWSFSESVGDEKLDAVQLDEQVEELFKQQFFHAVKFLGPGYLQHVLPELELLFRSWIFKNSVYDKKCTFGQQMLSLKYTGKNFSNSKILWYYIYTIFLKYLKERATYNFTSNTTIQNLIYKLERFQSFADIMNFILFIQKGRYPVLVDLILGLELSAEKLTRENLSDFSWTRELLWHNSIELVGTIISLINICNLKSKFTRVFNYMWWNRNQYSKITTQATMKMHTTCAICSNKPVVPHIMGCSHIFCYYCLLANKKADENFACPKCGNNSSAIEKFELV